MFPHGRIASIHYLEEEHKIVLDDKETGETWDKGKPWTVSFLFKLRAYDIEVIKLIQIRRYQTKIFSINKEESHEVSNV